MYVMTNRRKINGAAEILFPENLDKLASVLHSDIYIIPSSIHEVIAISSNGHSADELQEMVNDINMNQVDLEDRLPMKYITMTEIKESLPLQQMHQIRD